jgi:hypothetical protein
MALAAYYCPLVINDPILKTTCTAVLGAPPAKSQLGFEFSVDLQISNPNDVPIPALDVLLALSLFSAQDTQGLGSTCISLCGADSPGCTGAPKPGACTSSQPDIHTIAEFASGVPDLIDSINSGDTGDALSQSLIPAGGDVNLNLAFNLGVDAALGVIQKTAATFVTGLLKNTPVPLSIPVSVQGAVFVQLPVGGRIGVNFGPVQSTWTIN